MAFQPSQLRGQYGFPGTVDLFAEVMPHLRGWLQIPFLSVLQEA